MLLNILAFGAVVGGAIGLVAYLPQFHHLIKVKDSTGISIPSWWLYFTANALLLAYAVALKNISYILVESSACSANLLMIALTLRYRK